MKTPLQVYLDERDRRILEQLAQREGLSLAETIRSAIRRWATDAQAENDPILSLVGTVDDSSTPKDLSVRHDEYTIERSRTARTPGRRRRGAG